MTPRVPVPKMKIPSGLAVAVQRSSGDQAMPVAPRKLSGSYSPFPSTRTSAPPFRSAAAWPPRGLVRRSESDS